MKILFIFSGGRTKKLKLVQSGSAPSEFFYGYCELARSGYDVDFIDVVEETQDVFCAKLLNKFYFKWQMLPCRTTGDLLTGLYRQIAEINKYNVVVATTTGIGFSLELLRAVGILKSKVLTIHCGVMNYTYNWPTNALTRYLLKRGAAQVFGAGEYHAMQTHYSIKHESFEVNEFGIDTSFWGAPGTPRRGGYILSVGNCGRRDYDLLANAASRLRLPVKLLTDRQTPDMPENVEQIRGRIHAEHEIPDLELKTLYQQATMVIVPLRDTLQPSGQSVTLQAMASGAPVILSKTKGLWNRQLMVDKENCYLVAPDSPDEMVSAVETILNDSDKSQTVGRAGMNTVIAHWTIGQFARRVYAACERLLCTNL